MNCRDKKRRRNRLYRMYGKRCQQCGKTNSLTVDHIIPLSQGGTNALSNLQILCRACNQKKGASLPPMDGGDLWAAY
ncbi:MAG: HNH endonuclease [Actinomycetia bacterium]|nr:HNH endonuclease [Actinomycetes bacterium]